MRSKIYTVPGGRVPVDDWLSRRGSAVHATEGLRLRCPSETRALRTLSSTKERTLHTPYGWHAACTTIRPASIALGARCTSPLLLAVGGSDGSLYHGHHVRWRFGGSPCRQRASDAFQSECQARPGGVGCRWDLDLKRVWDVKVRMAQHRRSEQTNGPACA